MRNHPQRLRRFPWMALLFTAIVAIFWPRIAFAGPQDGLKPPGIEVDRSTPQRAIRLLIDQAHDNHYDQAAYALDLSNIPSSKQATEGPILARKLTVVLNRKLWLVVDDISDAPEGNPEDGLMTEKLGTIPLQATNVPITLQRAVGPGGTPIWLVSRNTLAAVPALYEMHGPGYIGERMPSVLRDFYFLEMAAWQWLGIIIAPVLGWIFAALFTKIAAFLLGRIVKRTEGTWDDKFIEVARQPVNVLLMPLIATALVHPLHLAIAAQHVVDRILETIFILAIAWLVIRIISLAGDFVLDRILKRHGSDVLARGDKTRITMFGRIATVAVVIIAGSLVLVQFEVVRQVGMSLLASAGIAGVVLGFAAQRSIATLLAGLQLSMSESVRIGDTVIVEGEWGEIEEITLTYVVVKIWDLRRLIIPITYLLEKPFQNWTRGSADLLGTVTVHADYTVPIDVMREEVKRLCKASPDWDGKSAGLIVLDATSDTVILRALVSAENASKQWNIRCHVREGLVAFLQSLEGGRYLPKSRVTLATPPATPNP